MLSRQKQAFEGQYSALVEALNISRHDSFQAEKIVFPL
jgi:hypothetical protein